MAIANRIGRLGTETAFAVSEDARAWAAKGHDVYPFHLGDMNIRTPLNIIEAAHKAMLDGKTGYCPAAGIPELREVIAADLGKNRGISFKMENVSIQPGGKPVIGKFFQALMNEGDEVLYPNPGYPIYESQIQFVGGVAVPYGYRMTKNGFEMERDKIEAAITKRTRFFVYNNGQNPLGAESTDEEMQWLADLCIRHNLWVLADEPYFHTRYSGKSKSITSLPGMQERSVILMSFSKRYAMTGWRLGGALGPKAVIDVINKLNVNQESCSCQFIQYAGVEALKGDQSGALEINRVLKERRDVLVAALRDIKGVTVYNPEVTFYLFPDVTEVFKRRGYSDQQKFRLDTLRETGISFCSRSHFGKPLPGEDRVYIRFAFSGINVDRIREGLAKLKAYWES
ncbi:MAG TPA: aminotransferase class I/II-fold pyridoxal phosphate-dependent enzyme [Kiritimatiellia bacterium]|nr:aminotransferase class I/II-fold pyridoxal phosphate-dependent enzyme [Kiritimatiellia bacterium]HSA17749.1 aminotransferase class I/II-fold pyridoxal phosphate-dependent enzyme [Kiritimatiellia bacterium]